MTSKMVVICAHLLEHSYQPIIDHYCTYHLIQTCYIFIYPYKINQITEGSPQKRKTRYFMTLCQKVVR